MALGREAEWSRRMAAEARAAAPRYIIVCSWAAHSSRKSAIIVTANGTAAARASGPKLPKKKA